MTNPVTGFCIRPFMQRRNERRLIIHQPGGIREEQFVTIGGIEQWVTIRGHDRSNPVLLILHGGPGSPYTPFNSWLGEWEHSFTVVQWDQRGSGKTFRKSGEAGTGPLSFQQLASDGLELVGYLCALLMIRQHPELFYAYGGANQNGPGGSEASYALTQEAAERVGDKKGLVALRAMGDNKSTWTYTQCLRMNKIAINASTSVPHMVNDLMLPALLFAPDYKMSDIQAVQKGMEYSAGQLFEEMKTFDFDALGYHFDIPFFVFQGEEDILTPAATAKAYLAHIHAPQKAFVPLKGAGHLAEFCNPHQFVQELVTYVLPQVQ
jgi:pimeloyl-ACP methyl ester carboxylesterase